MQGIIPERSFQKGQFPKRPRIDQSQNLMRTMGIYDWFENGRFENGRFGTGPSGTQPQKHGTSMIKQTKDAKKLK